MKTSDLAKFLRKSASEIIDNDLRLADALYQISDHLVERSEGTRNQLQFPSFGTEFNPRTRVKLLSTILLQLTTIYESSISSKQISYVSDLVEKIEVEYFDDEENDSSFAQQLRLENYEISAHDSEFSLQVRISNLLQELMPSGAWIVE